MKADEKRLKEILHAIYDNIADEIVEMSHDNYIIMYNVDRVRVRIVEYIKLKSGLTITVNKTFIKNNPAVTDFSYDDNGEVLEYIGNIDSNNVVLRDIQIY